jgi:hypothetical protein
MKRQASLFACLALALGCSSSGSTAVTIDSLMPASNEVSGWAEDPSVLHPGLNVAHNANEAEALVDGDAAPFTRHNFVAFAWDNYVNTTAGYKMDFRIWEMADAAASATLFVDLQTQEAIYSGQIWAEATIGDGGRVAAGTDTIWVNVHKGEFYLEALLAYGAGTTADAQAAAEAFMSVVVAQIP